ncbi:uncharacterized protein PRD47_012067 [Ara ararauna]
MADNKMSAGGAGKAAAPRAVAPPGQGLSPPPGPPRDARILRQPSPRAAGRRQRGGVTDGAAATTGGGGPFPAAGGVPRPRRRPVPSAGSFVSAFAPLPPPPLAGAAAPLPLPRGAEGRFQAGTGRLDPLEAAERSAGAEDPQRGCPAGTAGSPARSAAALPPPGDAPAPRARALRCAVLRCAPRSSAAAQLRRGAVPAVSGGQRHALRSASCGCRPSLPVVATMGSSVTAVDVTRRCKFYFINLFKSLKRIFGQ